MKATKTIKFSKIIGIVSLLLLIALLVTTAACSKEAPATSTTNASTTQPVAKPIKLVFSFFEPPSSAIYTMLVKPWLEDVAKQSNGRLQIETHTSGELVDLIGTYDAIVKGTIDIGYYFPSMASETFSMADVTTFFSFDKYVGKKSRVAWDLYKAFPEYQNQYKDTHCMWTICLHSIGIGTTKKPIHTLADVKGMKITVIGKWNSERQLALGFVPTSLPPDAVVTSLQTGVLDATGSGSWQLKDLNWGPALKYFSTIDLNEMEACMVMNKDKWNALPVDIQKIFNDTAEAAIDKFDSDMIQLSKVRLASANKDYGIEVIDIPMTERANWAEKDKPVVASYAAFLESKGLPGNKYVSEFKNFQDKYASSTDPYR